MGGVEGWENWGLGNSLLRVPVDIFHQIPKNINTFLPLVGMACGLGCRYRSGGGVCGCGRLRMNPRKFLIRMQSREGRGVANPFRVGAGGAP